MILENLFLLNIFIQQQNNSLSEKNLKLKSNIYGKKNSNNTDWFTMKNKSYHPWFLDHQPTGNHYLQFFFVSLVCENTSILVCINLSSPSTVSWYLLFFVLNLNLSWLSFNSNTHSYVILFHGYTVFLYECILFI